MEEWNMKSRQPRIKSQEFPMLRIGICERDREDKEIPGKKHAGKKWGYKMEIVF